MPINTSFSLQKDVLPSLDEGLHFHPEFELIYVLKGDGMKIIGDKMSSFVEGDLAFLGSNLPHLWRNNNSYHQAEKQHTEVIIIQFPADFLGKDFFDKPAMSHIAMFFQKAHRGLDIHGKTHAAVVEKVTEMQQSNDFTRILLLLDILHILAVAKDDLTELTDIGYSYNHMVNDTARMDKIYKYIMDHFKHDVNLDEIASVASLSSSAFCKYFKKRTDKSFSTFLNEVKISHACKLLMEKEADKSISQICYESGFKSLTNFNRQFKILTNYTPHEYRRQYL